LNVVGFSMAMVAACLVMGNYLAVICGCGPTSKSALDGLTAMTAQAERPIVGVRSRSTSRNG
jgi:hypothetical protein